MAQKVGRGIALLFHDRGTRRAEWSAARPGRTLPPGKARYPFYRRLGRPQDRSERAENLVPPGFDLGPSSPLSVAILTELPGSHFTFIYYTQIYVGIFTRSGLRIPLSAYRNVLRLLRYREASVGDFQEKHGFCNRSIVCFPHQVVCKTFRGVCSLFSPFPSLLVAER